MTTWIVWFSVVLSLACRYSASIEDSSDTSGDSTVETGDSNGEPTFSGDVHPMLWESCGGCHLPAFAVMALTGDPAEDYDIIMPYVDVVNPMASLLLTKATGVQHEKIWEVGGNEFETTIAWIENGAVNN